MSRSTLGTLHGRLPLIHTLIMQRRLLNLSLKLLNLALQQRLHKLTGLKWTPEAEQLER